MAAMIPTPTSTRVLPRSSNTVSPLPPPFLSLLRTTTWTHHLQLLLRQVQDIIRQNLPSRLMTINFRLSASGSPLVLACCWPVKASTDLLRSHAYSRLSHLSIRKKSSKRKRRKGGASVPFLESLEWIRI